MGSAVIATGSLGGQVQEPPHPADKFAHLLVAERIVEAEHRPRMGDLGQRRGRRRAKPLRRRIRPNQMRILLLQLAVLADQRVIFGVRNLRRILVVIELVVMRDLLGQAHQPVGGLSGAFVHSIPASSSAIFATLFMFRAVPCFTAGSFSFDLPMPSP